MIFPIVFDILNADLTHMLACYTLRVFAEACDGHPLSDTVTAFEIRTLAPVDQHLGGPTHSGPHSLSMEQAEKHHARL